jgi:hypothetical protein
MLCDCRQVVSILAEEELFVLGRFANALQIEVGWSLSIFQ